MANSNQTLTRFGPVSNWDIVHCKAYSLEVPRPPDCCCRSSGCDADRLRGKAAEMIYIGSEIASVALFRCLDASVEVLASHRGLIDGWGELC